MKNVGPLLRQLALWQKVVIGALLLLIFLTWLAVCAVLASFFIS